MGIRVFGSLTVRLMLVTAAALLPVALLFIPVYAEPGTSAPTSFDVAAAGGAALLLLWGGIRLFVTAPLSNLRLATRRLGSGEFEVSAGLGAGSREMRELGQCFNRMAHALAQRERRVHRYQRRLHALVRGNRARRRAAERELQSILDHVEDVIYREDLEGRFVWVSPSVSEAIGYRPAELVGRKVVGCFAEPCHKLHFDRELKAQGGRIHHFEAELVHRHGRGLPVSINAQYYHDEEGRVAGVEAVVRNIAEQVEARRRLLDFNQRLEQTVAERTRELERANRELEAFSYSVSHDLRAPLRSIDGFSQVLSERFGGDLPASARDYLQRVRRASQRMGTLIDDLLSLSRLNQHPLRRSPVDLATLAAGVVEELRGQEPDRHVEVEIPPLPDAHCDPGLGLLLLENLIGNAWKYTVRREPARIGLGARTDQAGRCWYWVRDNGAGFDMRFADRLFSPFQRLHRSEEFPGNGIGLATVQRILQRHHGEIVVEAAPGGGATFMFHFGDYGHTETA